MANFRERLVGRDFLQRLLDINQRENESSTLTSAECCVAGMLGIGLERLGGLYDVDVLPYLPQLISEALRVANRAQDSTYVALRRKFEQLSRHNFADFSTLNDGEEACDKTLLAIERVVIAAAGNQYVAGDVKGALRANRYIAEQHIAYFCRSTSAGRELVDLAAQTQRSGIFGSTQVQSGRDDDGQLVIRIIYTYERIFVFYWSGVGAQLHTVIGNVTPQVIEDALCDVAYSWKPDDFRAV